MNRRAIAVLLLLLAAAAAPARAGWFGISVQSDSAEVTAGAHLGSDPRGRFALGGLGLYREDDAGDTELLGLVARFEATAEWLPETEFGIGVEALAGEGGGHDVGAAAIGIQAEYAPASWKGAFVGGGIAYAPGILSWDETEDLRGWRVYGGYRVTPKIEIFAEYHELRADFGEFGRHDLDDTIKFGFRGRF